MLKHSHDIISEGKITNRSDGLVSPEDSEWGMHLLNYEYDHLEMVGFNSDVVPYAVYSVIADNIRLCEVRGNKEEAFAYGVDHLSLA